MNQTSHVTTQQQLHQCLDIRKKVFVIEQQVDESLEIDEFDETPQSCCHVLYEMDGQPAATGRMRPYKSDTMKLQRIAVLKEARGTGAGRAIVTALEEEARRLGYAYTLLDAQCQAEPFYLKLGYVTVSPETFLDAGIPHVRMTKKL
ncbi:GNAT family N-acetyltransferase [Paenibacillus doosanensis]|uniref:N-acetyltransferase YjcF n=1 Tax=Paenibacillus konkukensis TaxID=2020716 RepID=A0ABY4RSH9_9BACL|nr:MULTISPECIES: GNAT family N-acetyltransferase [Paenibacillus]MCS7463293.1 GNAT family N-acetyltransferase [Paenibacillus doosanensis]UQZ85170.1 putative N-acetyltransferase YjcF [Paenibacillus konkukensis]